MQRPGAGLDRSALASSAGALPFAENASAECMVVLVVARHSEPTMETIVTAALPTTP